MEKWLDGYKVVDTIDHGKTLVSSSACSYLRVTYHKNKKHIIAKRNNDKDGPLFLYKTLDEAKMYHNWIECLGDLRIYRCKYIPTDEVITIIDYHGPISASRPIFADKIKLVGRPIKLDSVTTKIKSSDRIG